MSASKKSNRRAWAWIGGVGTSLLGLAILAGVWAGSAPGTDSAEHLDCVNSVYEVAGDWADTRGPIKGQAERSWLLSDAGRKVIDRYCTSNDDEGPRASSAFLERLPK